ncbi:MAG TPA: hypothetical protein VFN38_12005 [Gemmatimonadaceae bacterium]|nr:hypothetical protein [Gemmatimonadaceae bacterium]
MAATLAVPGAGDWLLLSDELLAGLVHALNNRVTALSVCAELAALGDDQMLGEGILMEEVGRLQRAAALIGLLPARGHPEALEIAPVLADAIAIHVHHPTLRAIACTVDMQTGMQPVRVPRWALLRLLLIVVDAAKGAVQNGSNAAAAVQLTSDDSTVHVRAVARDGEGSYATEMAALCGGALVREGDTLVLSLPSLNEVRRRERTGRVG